MAAQGPATASPARSEEVRLRGSGLCWDLGGPHTAPGPAPCGDFLPQPVQALQLVVTSHPPESPEPPPKPPRPPLRAATALLPAPLLFLPSEAAAGDGCGASALPCPPQVRAAPGSPLPGRYQQAAATGSRLGSLLPLPSPPSAPWRLCPLPSAAAGGRRCLLAASTSCGGGGGGGKRRPR